MSDSCNIPHPLNREGTYQFERFPVALGKDARGKEYVDIDERSAMDLLRQSAEFARFVKYYNSENVADGDWRAFFEDVYDYNAKKLKFNSIQELENAGSQLPHLALFVAFLKLFGYAQNNLNQLKYEHLDFYYKTVLKLQPGTSQPDKAAVYFIPEKSAVQVKIAKGTVLRAGKDSTGKELYYQTNEELIVNQAKVAALKTVFTEVVGDQMAMYKSEDARIENIPASAETIKSWVPFGSSLNAPTEVGFAVASPMFYLGEGRRRISLFVPGIHTLNRDALRVEFTGPKGWVSAEIDTVPGTSGSGAAASYLLVKIEPGLDAMVAYNEAVHQSAYNVQLPMVRIGLDHADKKEFKKAYDILKQIVLEELLIRVNVTGVKTLILQNDLGVLDPAKPFFPFGSQPVKHKSTLYIGKAEIFNKYLSSFHVAIDWKGMPGNMRKYYAAYSVLDDTLTPDKKALRGFMSQWPPEKGNSAHFPQGHPPGKLEILDNGEWKEIKINKKANYQITSKKDWTNTYKSSGSNEPLINAYARIAENQYTSSSRSGFARLVLGYDFGHKQYPKLLTDIAITKAQSGSGTLPNAPYTPEFNSLHMDYTAEDTLTFGNSDHSFFHITPHGYKEIKTANDAVIPAFSEEGNLYIGLSDISEAQTISVYFQMQNDTGNLEKSIGETNKVSWYYLAGDSWELFEQQSILSDTTVQFSNSGFIRFSLDAKALQTRTLLQKDWVWIRATVATDSDAYSRLVDVKTQAVEAVFTDHGNDPNHLKLPLPAGTIAKFETKPNGIKAVAQPFASYHGQMAETNTDFYTRVSERLRHKQRAWSIWDIERLILQKFTTVHKVKCISHATRTSEYAPGKILIVALPNPANVNSENILQPRVAKNLLIEMKEFVKRWTSAFAEVEVISPNYLPLQIKCDVKLLPQFADQAYYKKVLQEELAGFLAPWSNGSGENISFGGKIYKSQIMNFIEEREYVDFVTNLDVYSVKNNIKTPFDDIIKGGDESAVLTSVVASEHQVSTTAVC